MSSKHWLAIVCTNEFTHGVWIMTTGHKKTYQNDKKWENTPSVDVGAFFSFLFFCFCVNDGHSTSAKLFFISEIPILPQKKQLGLCSAIFSLRFSLNFYVTNYIFIFCLSVSSLGRSRPTEGNPIFILDPQPL